MGKRVGLSLSTKESTRLGFCFWAPSGGPNYPRGVHLLSLLTLWMSLEGDQTGRVTLISVLSEFFWWERERKKITKITLKYQNFHRRTLLFRLIKEIGVTKRFTYILSSLLATTLSRVLLLPCSLRLFPRKRKNLNWVPLFFLFLVLITSFFLGVTWSFHLGWRGDEEIRVVLFEKWKEGSKWVLLLLLLSSLGPISPINLLQLEFLNLCFLHRLRWDVCLLWFLIVQFNSIFFAYVHFMLERFCCVL